MSNIFIGKSLVREGMNPSDLPSNTYCVILKSTFEMAPVKGNSPLAL